MNSDIFEQDGSGWAQIARACLVYSMVPYLGILFVPFAVAFGVFGYVTAIRKPEIGDRRRAAVGISLSVAVLCVQIFLWWLLFAVPELGRR